MTNPTSNYGWVLPNSADLVTDLPADFDVALQGVDTRLKALQPGTTLGDLAYSSATANTNTRLGVGSSGQVLTVAAGVPSWATPTAGMTNPMTTTGDTIYSSSGSTPARLGIGSTGNVLTVAGGVPTWAAPSAGANWVLENAGGTALTGAATITISGITGKDKIMVLLSGASSASGSSEISLRFNSDSGTNYYYFGSIIVTETAYANTIFTRANGGAGIDRCKIIKMSNSAPTIINAYHLTSGANSSGVKVYNYSSGTSTGGANAEVYSAGGYYNSSSAISSVSVVSSSGDFDAGTVFVYTSA